MRVQKSMINAIVAIFTFLITFLPIFVLRKVFTNTLGSEMLGLSSLYTNIIGYLSIVEMGVGSAIIYALYKPYAEEKWSKVNGYLSYYGKFYKRAGWIVLLIGLAMTPIIHIFINDKLDLRIIRGGFILVLLNTFIGYLFTYKHCIVNVAQEGYKISLTIAIAKLSIAIVQIIILKLGGNFIQYLIIQVIINLIIYYILNRYINNKYKCILKSEGILLKEERTDLAKNIKALFFHKIGGIFVLSTDNIVISYFLNLKMVAIYNSYWLIINACIGVMWQVMNGISASIGNLLVSKDLEYSFNIHKKIFFVNFWITSMIAITLLNVMDQFIVLWMGEEYLIGTTTLIILIFNMYFQIMRDSVEKFKEASGEYYRDRYAPLFEGGINLVFSLFLVRIMGLSGVFLGTTLSNLLVVFWVKPKIVYKYVFKKPLNLYFKMYIKYFAIGCFPLMLTLVVSSKIKNVYTIEAFIINIIINVILINLIYVVFFWKNENLIYIKEILIKIKDITIDKMMNKKSKVTRT